VGLDIPTETALRVARWLQAYAVVDDPDADDEDEVGGVLGRPFKTSHDEMVIVKDIDFVGLCEHHLLPFHGKAALGYIPDGQLVGLSKIGRLIDYMCRKPTLQEAITRYTANAFDKFLGPKGVMVVLYNVEHSCMSMRGVKKLHAKTTTSAITGVFKEVPAARHEFLALLSA
jgi:GTP cyclohydrolase IA